MIRVISCIAVCGLALGCTPKATPTKPAAEKPFQSQLCTRTSPECWDCAPVQWPSTTPLRKAKRVCCEGECAQPVFANAPCAAECGDPNGDGVNDTCLVRASCPEMARAGEFAYDIPTDPAMFQALCGPLPTDFPTDHGDGAPVLCGPEPAMFTIHGYQMGRGASRRTGPGLCYGIARVGRTGQTVKRCGKYHCQTLLYCDGEQRAQYCSIAATCDKDGRVNAAGFSW